MKPLYLLDYQGHVRPGRATLEQIADVLEGRVSYRLATVTLDDGAIVAAPLDASSLLDLRVEIEERRKVALRVVLDHALALVRSADGIPGISAGGYYSGPLSIDFAMSPWARDVVEQWAAEQRIHIVGEPPPSSPGKWHRRDRIALTDETYSQTVAHLSYPVVDLTAEENVARDAEEEGRTVDAKALRAGDRQSIPVVEIEEPF